MGSAGCNFETEVRLGWVGDGDNIVFYHPIQKKCVRVLGRLHRIRKGLWSVLCLGGSSKGKYVTASSALAASRKFYKQFETGNFK